MAAFSDHALGELIREAKGLIQAAPKSSQAIDETALALFLVNFEAVIRKIWQTAEVFSSPHALIACELLDAIELFLAREAQLRPEQLETIANVVQLLGRESLTMKDAAEADRILLAHGINAFFPIQDGLASHYERNKAEAG